MKSILEHFAKKAKSAAGATLVPQDTAQPQVNGAKERVALAHTVRPASASSPPSPATDSRLSPEIQIVEFQPSGLRKESPIIVDSSPVRPPRPSKNYAPSKPVYSIFAIKPRVESAATPASGTEPQSARWAVPFPDSSSQHIRGPQTNFQAPRTSLSPRRDVPNPPGPSMSLSALLDSRSQGAPLGSDSDALHIETSSSFSTRAAHLTNIPTEHMQSHPVIAHIAKSATSDSDSLGHSHKLWTDKWRPTRANHVLGNEEQAMFLRQWLCALEVHTDSTARSHGSRGVGQSINKSRGIKRRGVIRAVERRDGRKRRRVDSDDDDDSWIVYSDDITEDESQAVEDIEEDQAEKPLENEHPRLYRHQSSQDIDHLTNTILLSGPNSSGKTAAVYACAEELGWEVFEVYPGVGKRSGANLDNLVGEVGKNHLVRKTGPRYTESGTDTRRNGSLKSAFTRGKEKRVQNDDREGSPPEAGFVEEPPLEPHEARETRQSLILLEEVDVLFRDDSNFWGTLVNLIRDCKRPVVLTCNDASLVPVADLPLQDVLNFNLCSTPVAASFLQALCCAEGYLLERDVLSRFYENSDSFDTSGDLRKAIHNLQFWCPENTQGVRTAIGYQHGKETENIVDREWPSFDVGSMQVQAIGDGQAYHADLVSFADCYLLRNAADTPKEMIWNEETLNSADDVLGFRTLKTNGSAFRQNQFAYHDRDELIMSTAIELSRGTHDDDSWAWSLLQSTRALLWDRVLYDGLVREFGNNIVAGRSQILRRPVFDCDYLPWIRQIIAAEDKQAEAVLTRDQPGPGRRTRNSQRFIRTIELNEKARIGLDATDTTQSAPMKSLLKSPLLPLAPLEYLQNQRRGSITDPSLHAAPPAQKSSRQYFRHASDTSIPTSSSTAGVTGPSSSYVFGDATAISNDNPALRKILRSPSPGMDIIRVTEGNLAGEGAWRSTFPYPQHLYSLLSAEARRPSAAGLEQQTVGVKRKISSDRKILEEPQLTGPGITGGGMEVEMEAPPPKRRGSAIDTSRIASLTLNDRLNDRRNSVGGTGSHWIHHGDRRNSASSNSPAGPGADSPRGRFPPGNMAHFGWPVQSHPESSNMQQHQPGPPHVMPQIAFNPDRRLSVPNALSVSPSAPPGPSRALRSHSRPPSRQTLPETPQSAPSDETSPDPSFSSAKTSKEPGATPYSRSPELRVSHKLAERKRRKEMKDLFDELRDQLPADRGMKASKWEILSKAIDFVNTLKQNQNDMAREIEMLRHELDAVRQNAGLPPFAPPHVVYAPGPIPASYPLPPGILPPPPHHPITQHSAQHSPHVHHNPSPHPPPHPPALSRPASSQSQNMYPPAPGGQVVLPPQNGNMSRPPESKLDINLLFHKKKKPTSASSPRPPAPPSAPNRSQPGSPAKARPSPQPSLQKPKADDDEADMQLPEGSYQEFRIMSSALNGWKYDVMKFDSRKSIDILRWQGPIKLNRKDLRREDPSLSGVGEAVRPMLGPDGQPVIGSDGRTVMVDHEGRPVTENGSSAIGAGKGKGPTNGKKKFQKKTRQVFIVPEQVRNLRKEERYPWVIEDANGQEVWTAQLDDLGKAETHAFFMPAANDVFKFVPSHRYYRFQKKVKHDLPTDTTSVESAYQQSLKRDPSSWLHQRNGKGPSAATAAMFKAEADGNAVGSGGSLVYQTQQSLGPGGRRLRAVDSGADNLFGEDDEESGATKRRVREFGGEGDMDEVAYEEDFADDEEKMDVDDSADQEAKELEERLKKEYKTANKTLRGDDHESDEEDGKPVVSKQTKRMQKMLRAREGNNVYESEEEEENPYASSQEEEDDEEENTTQTGPAVQSQSQAKPESPPQSQTPDLNKPPLERPTLNGNGTPNPSSRASSPAPGLGGHSVVAKRATSPKIPKLKSTTVSRSGSPLASRASSPVSAPVAITPNGTSQNGYISTTGKKRKAEDGGSPSPTSPTSNGLPKPKKRKGHPPGPTAAATPTGPLEARLLIEWLRNTPMENASTRECIQYFTPYLTDEEKKAQFTVLVKEIAQLKNGVLVLRPAYRDSSAPGTPVPVASG
ncbi:hypothetical protein D9757_004890 [Collybiopsis confluens]|uniref:BHLH domain-containing protein n=1 Tax=Collybiopsis confluens TaxID=2823264 RepID=A0A8H5MCP4_9AGAR|nr:hypothetical protein D9757_004890 [Collybiopsis confluens]